MNVFEQIPTQLDGIRQAASALLGNETTVLVLLGFCLLAAAFGRSPILFLAAAILAGLGYLQIMQAVGPTRILPFMSVVLPVLLMAVAGYRARTRLQAACRRESEAKEEMASLYNELLANRLGAEDTRPQEGKGPYTAPAESGESGPDRASGDGRPSPVQVVR